MDTTNENIRQLLEMLNNPDAYSEQEIRDIINRDEDTRETYRIMVETKHSSRHRQDKEPVDVDAAWNKFNQKLQPKQHSRNWMKMAASFIGLLLVSGIAFAAIHMVLQYHHSETLDAELTTNTESPATTAPADTIASDTLTVQPVIFDNVPLEDMLKEIAAHYHVKVTFQNDEVRDFRFRFVWNPQQGIEQVINDLNQFERLTVTLNEHEMTIK